MILSSCSRTIYVQDIIRKNEMSSNNHFKYDSKLGYYTCKSKSYSQKKQILIDSFRTDFKNYDEKFWTGTLNVDEIKRLNEAKLKLADYKFMEFDSAKNIIVSFDEQLPSLNYTVFAVHYWDYSNARFLFPLLLLGNRIHLINQCVNRAIDEAVLNNADGVIINSNLYVSKLFVLKK